MVFPINTQIFIEISISNPHLMAKNPATIKKQMGGVGWGDGGQRAQSSSYKIDRFWGSRMYSVVILADDPEGCT